MVVMFYGFTFVGVLGKSNYGFSDTSVPSLLVVIWFWFLNKDDLNAMQFFQFFKKKIKKNYSQNIDQNLTLFLVLWIMFLTYWFGMSFLFGCKCCICDKILQLLKSFIFKFVLAHLLKVAPSCVLCVFVWHNKRFL